GILLPEAKCPIGTIERLARRSRLTNRRTTAVLKPVQCKSLEPPVVPGCRPRCRGTARTHRCYSARTGWVLGQISQGLVEPGSVQESVRLAECRFPQSARVPGQTLKKTLPRRRLRANGGRSSKTGCMRSKLVVAFSCL